MINLYYDLMSQPARALYIALKYSKIPFEPKLILLTKGEHLTEEYENLNRFKKIPLLDHDGFILSESVAIIQYLGQLKMLDENLFPSDLKLQARVNEYLSWQQFGIRAPCGLFFRLLKVEPMLTGQPVNEKKVAEQKQKMEAALDLFEEKWVGRGNKFILGDKPTIADIFACCEIEQPRMAGYDPKVGRPNIDQWMNNVKQEFNPFYDEAHAILNKIALK